jgi:predicted O-methyltransferase YrrM
MASIIRTSNGLVKRVRRVARQHMVAVSARRTDPAGLDLARELKERKRLTFLPVEALLDIRDRARQMEQMSVAGDFLEAGCALGGSAIMIAASKAKYRKLFVHDIFGVIPPPSSKDGRDVHTRYDVIVAGEAKGFGSDAYYGYQPELEVSVARSFEEMGYPCQSNNVHLVKGLFDETVRPTEPIALAHIDGDWYESVKVCLERIWPFLVVGGVIVIDDYDDWSGCRTAVDEFLVNNPNCIVERRSRIHLVRSS